MVEGEIKEYATKDEMMETVEVKRNYLSILATHYLRTTPLIERACKDILSAPRTLRLRLRVLRSSTGHVAQRASLAEI